MDGSLPKKPCKTCKNRFHAGCLYKVRTLFSERALDLFLFACSGLIRVIRRAVLCVVLILSNISTLNAAPEGLLQYFRIPFKS